MVATLIISIITFILVTISIIFFPKIRIGKIKLDTYWMITLLSAIILISFSLSPIQEVFKQLTSNSAINPLKILVLFFSMTILSIYLDEIGLFHFLAVKATKIAKNNQLVLFFIFYLLTSILTIFTSNDIVILTLTPFICFFAKNTKINPLPYLIAEFAAANTWSMMFIIGNPTNIYLATSAGIGFIDYFKVMWLPTIFAGLTELFIVFLLFRKQLKTPIEVTDEDYKIESKLDLIIGISILFICLVFLVISSYINIEMWLISLSSATILLLVALIIRLITHKHWEYLSCSFKRLPYPLIPFFLSMFVIVVALNYQGISLQISKFLNQGSPIWVYGYSSLLASNLINNIPMSILFSNLPNGLEGLAYNKAIFGSVIGSNIGAFLTPIGALAGIMFSSLLNKFDVKYSFIDFVKYGLIIAIPTASMALLGLFVITL
ncbi:MAG: hypothetical protein IJK27_00490 [Bacilli bacterium]|nr:hypothetical protein [Bacilli bacterium]